MLADELKTRIEAQVAVLAGRVEHALDLVELVGQGALPQSRYAAFVVPVGLRPQSGGESAAGAFTQSLDEVLAVVLVVNSAGDVTGAKAAPRVDELVWQLIQAVAGWAPADLAATLYTGDFRFLRGEVISLTRGAVFYQVEFAIQLQLRIL